MRRYWAPTAVVGFIGISGFGSMNLMQRQKAQKEKEKERREQLVKKTTRSSYIPRIKNPVLNIQYQTDTLERVIPTLLFYSAGKITRYYVENNNSYRMQLPYFAHEEWHHRNDELRYRIGYYFTPTEYYKLCMHDEISANIAAVLTARYEYLAAPNRTEKRKVINRYKNTYLKFYFDGVAKGKIKPESRVSQDREKEYKFIANGTMKMWMKKYSRHYAPTTWRMLQRYVGRFGLVADSKKTYQMMLNNMYTIGGVNFAKYLDNDIPLKEDKVLLAEQLPKIKFMKTGGVEILDIVNQNYPLMAEVGMDKQVEIYQNLLMSSQLKYLLRNKTAEELAANPQLVNLCFRKVMNAAFGDPTFKEAVTNFPIFSETRCNLNLQDRNFAETVRKMYTFRGMDLTTMIADFSPDKVPVRTSFDNMFENMYREDFLLENIIYPKLAAQLEKSEHPIKKEDKRPFSPKPEKPVMRPRRSESMRINLPNLREPILLYASPDDESRIFECIREFDGIPQVFKNCNTLAQQRYLKEHKEYIDTLKHFQTTGSIDIGRFAKTKTQSK